jgi:hypothetical protein
MPNKTSLRELLAVLGVDLSCNMSYYLANKSELEKDLKRQIAADVNLEDELVLKKIEQELFYNQMVKLFGTQTADDDVQVDGESILYGKSFMVRDFKKLTSDSNNMLFTAKRENF